MQNLYRHFDKDNNLLYVGVSLNALNRLAQHKQHAHWFNQINRVEIESFETRKEALEAEREAIYSEKPKHNLMRPTPKRVLKEKTKAQESKQRLVERIVQFNVTYTIPEASGVLNVSENQIKKWMDSGEIGFIVKRIVNTKYGKRPLRIITGWQLIDFIENWQAGKIKTPGLN